MLLVATVAPANLDQTPSHTYLPTTPAVIRSLKKHLKFKFIAWKNIPPTYKLKEYQLGWVPKGVIGSTGFQAISLHYVKAHGPDFYVVEAKTMEQAHTATAGWLQLADSVNPNSPYSEMWGSSHGIGIGVCINNASPIETSNILSFLGLPDPRG